MNPNKLQKCLDAVQIGRVLLTEPAFPLLEAFSGNALYCGRGMPTMKNKTVKEVCALTGLTGKHLYYFHHERVVRAVAYANYSVEGNDGYKLYDDAAQSMDVYERLLSVKLSAAEVATMGATIAADGRNPKTGETIKIAASKVPGFKAGAALKKSVN